MESFTAKMKSNGKPGPNLKNDEIDRYSRQIALPELGLDGQKKLKDSSVLCIGSGGLGSPLLLYLAAAGIGRIGIVDFDNVEESNLHRQIIHSTKWINKPKVDSARQHLLDINPNCQVDIYHTSLNKENALNILKTFDIVCDCTDNFPTRYLISDACSILNKPNIYGSIEQFQGQVTVFNLDESSPTYRDLVPNPPPPELVPSCSEAGVMGVMPGLIGLIQANETIKIITGIGKSLNGRLLVVDGKDMTFRELTLKQSKYRKRIRELINYDKFCMPSKSHNTKLIDTQITVQELKETIMNKANHYVLIDVRETYEYEFYSIDGSKSIPLKKIENGEAIEEIRRLIKGKDLYLYCKSGKRSNKALITLKNHGIKGKNIRGGIDAWKMEIMPILNKE